MQDVNDVIKNDNNTEQTDEWVQDIINEFRINNVDMKLQHEEIEHIIEKFKKNNYNINILEDAMSKMYTENDKNAQIQIRDFEHEFKIKYEQIKTEKNNNEKAKVFDFYQIVKYEPITDNILQQNDIQQKIEKYKKTKQQNIDLKSHIMNQIIKYMPEMKDDALTKNEIIIKEQKYNL
jgi:hypothetical protein